MRGVRLEPLSVEAAALLAQSDHAYEARFGRRVLPDWLGFSEARGPLMSDRLGSPDTPWGAFLFIDVDGALVGIGGWKGEPQDGAAELGYSVAPERQGLGIATAAVAALVSQARAAGLALVCAHTLPERNAATAVLAKSGFTHVGDATEDGERVWRWELLLA